MNKYRIVHMNDKPLEMMTVDEKEEYCHSRFNMSYNEYINMVFWDASQEEKEQIKKDFEYPKRE